MNDEVILRVMDIIAGRSGLGPWLVTLRGGASFRGTIRRIDGDGGTLTGGESPMIAARLSGDTTVSFFDEDEEDDRRISLNQIASVT